MVLLWASDLPVLMFYVNALGNLFWLVLCGISLVTYYEYFVPHIPDRLYPGEALITKHLFAVGIGLLVPAVLTWSITPWTAVLLVGAYIFAQLVFAPTIHRELRAIRE